jgi:hypothetical protein
VPRPLVLAEGRGHAGPGLLRRRPLLTQSRRYPRGRKLVTHSASAANPSKLLLLERQTQQARGETGEREEEEAPE